MATDTHLVAESSSSYGAVKQKVKTPDNSTIYMNLDMNLESKVSLPEAEVTEHEFHEEVVTTKSTPKKMSCGDVRQKIAKIMHHHYFQIAVILLVLLDTAVVVTQIVVECEAKAEASEYLTVVEHALHYISITILSIFMVEITVKIFAMGLEILKHKFEVFDAIVVIISFFLDIFLSYGKYSIGVEFLILLRLWRIARVINGIIVSVKTSAEEKHEEFHKEINRLKQTVQQQTKQIESQKKEITGLKNQLKDVGIVPLLHEVDCSAHSVT